MTWRLANSLHTLLRQVNAKWPNRNKVSDGTIGDARHASRSSDHNPWIIDGQFGVVTAIDFTHDVRNGFDCEAFVNALVASRDKRIKYIIWNKKIWNPSVSPLWRDYDGRNPHNKHCHISVKFTKANYDDVRDWRF